MANRQVWLCEACGEPCWTSETLCASCRKKRPGPCDMRGLLLRIVCFAALAALLVSLVVRHNRAAYNSWYRAHYRARYLFHLSVRANEGNDDEGLHKRQRAD